MKKWKLPILTTIGIMLIALVHSGFEIHENIYTEVSGFLYNYSFPRPFWNQIADPLIHDWGLYQCRELSYLFDWMDAKFILISWINGFYHQFSLCAFLFFSLTILMQQSFLVRFFPKFGKIPSLLCSLVYAGSSAVSSFAFFRSSKHISAFVITAVLYLVFLILHKNFRKTGKETVLFFTLLILGSFVDRIVLFFTGTLTGMLGIYCMMEAFTERRKNSEEGMLIMLSGSFVIVILAIALNLFLIPYLIFKINGYYPSLLYQQKLPQPGISTILGGLEFLLRNLGKNFTGFSEFSTISGIFVVIAAGYIFFRGRNMRLFYGYLLTICAMTICASAMYLRHPAILWPDVIFGIYFKPFLAVFIFFLILALANLPGKYRKLILLLLVLIQFFSPYFSFQEKASDIYEFDRTNFQAVIKAIENPEIDIRTMAIPYRERLLAERIRFLRTGEQPKYDSPGKAATDE